MGFKTLPSFRNTFCAILALKFVCTADYTFWNIRLTQLWKLGTQKGAWIGKVNIS